MRREIEALLKEYGSAIELDFVRAPSGKVHIRAPEKPAWARDDERALERWSEAVEILTAGTHMVCGLSRWVDVVEEKPGRWVPVETFPDEELCARCVRGLGSQSVRAFEHPQPGDEMNDQLVDLSPRTC